MTKYVNLEILGLLTAGTGDLIIDLWVEGTGWVWIGTTSIAVAGTASWYTIDVTSYMDTPAKLNNAKLFLGFDTGGGGSIVLYGARLNANGTFRYVDNWTLTTLMGGVTLNGTAPYLNDHTDLSTNVTGAGINQVAMYWTFDHTYVGGPYLTIGTIEKYEMDVSEVYLEMAGATWTGDESDVECYLWVNGAWVDVGSMAFTNDPLTYQILDVSSVLDTILKVYDTRLKFVCNTNQVEILAIFHAILVVDGMVFWVNNFVPDVVDPDIILYGNTPYLQDTWTDAIQATTSMNVTCSYFEFEKMSAVGTNIGPLNLPYARLTDNVQTVMEKTYTSAFIPWEWWIDYNGAVQVAEERGSIRPVTLSAGGEIGSSLLESSSKQTAQRVRVVGGGESATQDLNTSDWQDDPTKMTIINSFYENIIGDKTVIRKEFADDWAQVILAQSSPLNQEITITIEDDPYSVNDFDVGDTITIDDPDTGLSGLYRIKTIEKTINPDSGETTILTCSKNKTDITDRLADMYKTLERVKNSSTYLDMFMGRGGSQTEIAASTLEDIWAANSSNKWITELPAEKIDPQFDECCSSGSLDWDSTADEFYVSLIAAGSIAYGAVWINDNPAFIHDSTALPLLQFSRNPRFQCEFIIDTLNGGNDWQTGDQTFFKIRGIDTCTFPFDNEGFGFYIEKTASDYRIGCVIEDSITSKSVIIKHIFPNVKYLVEARMEWDEKIVKFYFGRSDVDASDPDWGFRLRAILPLSLESDDCANLAPFHAQAYINSVSHNTKIYIYRWKTQANSSVVT